MSPTLEGSGSDFIEKLCVYGVVSMLSVRWDWDMLGTFQIGCSAVILLFQLVRLYRCHFGEKSPLDVSPG